MLVCTRLCDWCFGHFTSSKSPPQHTYSILATVSVSFIMCHNKAYTLVVPLCRAEPRFETPSQRVPWSRIHLFSPLSEETNRTEFQNMIWKTWDDEQRCSWGLCSSGMRHSVTEWSVPCGSKHCGCLMFMGRMSSEEFLHSVIHIPEKQKAIIWKMLVTNIAKHCGVIVSHLISLHNDQCITYLSPDAE